jgi:hypothetical protein
MSNDVEVQEQFEHKVLNRLAAWESYYSVKILAEQSLRCVGSETFTVNVCTEILLGYQLHQSLVKNQCFRDLLHVHHVNPVGSG